ncbi:MAG: hypothetical protein ACP5LN_00145 [Thermoproteota archaeon]|jgi:hypothetical protein
MNRALQKVFIVFEVLLTIVSIVPFLVWFLINFYYIKYKNNRIRSKVLKVLIDQGLPKSLSEEIVRTILPEVKMQEIGEIISNERYFSRRQNK